MKKKTKRIVSLSYFMMMVMFVFLFSGVGIRGVLAEEGEKLNYAIKIDQSENTTKYAELLNDIHDNPTKYVKNMDSKYDNIEDNDFAIVDINQDGINELVVSFTNTAVANMYTGIWAFDSNSNSVIEYANIGATCEYFSNGIIKVLSSHNQSYGETIWPYDLVKYDEISKEYVSFAGASCVDSRLDTSGKFYSTEKDLDNDGVIYYFTVNGEEPTPLTLEEYSELVKKYVPEEKKIEIEWYKLTNENINKLALDTNPQSTQLTISPDKYTCDVDEVVDLTASLVSSDITGEDVIWTSDNENIAIIDDTSYTNSSDNSKVLLHAKVKGISEGTANITVETKDEKQISIDWNSKLIENVREQVINHYIELWKPDGTYTSFSSEDRDTEDNIVFVLRYVMSDEKAEEIIANGGKPQTNSLVSLIYVNKSTGEVYDEGSHGDNWFAKLKSKDGVKASATVNVEKKKEEEIEPEPSEPTGFNPFSSEKDRWSFAHNKMGTYGYSVENNYLDYLKEGLSNTEKKQIDKEIKDEWGGSCHGMSIAAFLFKMNRLHPYNWNIKAKNLSDLEVSDSYSLINYYYLMQFTNIQKNLFIKTNKKSNKENLSTLENMVINGTNNNTPVVLGFNYKGTYRPDDGEKLVTKEKKGGHTIVAYGYPEEGFYIINYNNNSESKAKVDSYNTLEDIPSDYEGIIYTHRIKTYDINTFTTSGYVDEPASYVYYTDNKENWSIPLYTDIPNVNYKKRKINFITNDFNVLDFKNIEDTPNTTSILLEQPILISYNSQNIRIKDKDGKVSVIDGLNIEGDTNICTYYKFANNEDTSNINIILPDMNSTYEVTSIEENKELDLSIQYENLFAMANATSGNSVSFSPEGKVLLDSNKSDFEISLTFNEGYNNLPWHTISASGTNANEVSLEKTDEGVVLKGDNLKDVMVLGENDDETKEIKINTDEKEILIKDENNEMKAFVDTDNDGTFESELDDTVQEKEIKLDKSNISLEIGKEEQLKATITPEDLNENISWSSEDEKVATVDEKGLVKAIGEGTTNIKATIGDITTVCKVIVTQPNKNEDNNKEEIKNNTSNTNTTTTNNISNSNNKQTQSSSGQAKTIDKNYSKIIIFSMLSIISLVTIIGTKKKKVKKNK